MKTTTKFLLLASVLVLAFSTSTYGMNLGLYFGLSTPNDKMNDIYNSDNLNFDGGLKKLFRDGVDMGFHIGAKARFQMSDNAQFVGGIAWHKFPQSTINVKDPTTSENLTTLSTTQNIVPITAGINLFVLNSTIGVYACGELSYNYIFSSVDYPNELINLPIDTKPSDSRIGCGIGAGIDFNLGLLKLNSELKYNIANLIGRTDNEATKVYFTWSFGVYF